MTMFNTVENSELGQSYFFMQSDKGRLFVAKQVMEQLGYTGGSIAALSHHELKEGENYIKLIKKQNRDVFDALEKKSIIGSRASEVVMITENALKKILLSSNKPFAEKCYEFLFNEKMPLIYKKHKEPFYMEIILKAYPNMFVLQYNVLGFLIDAYCEKYKIALECDEKGHSGKKEYDEQRKIKIENSLGKLNWIRFNPDCSNFSFGDVIHQLNSLIYGNR